MSGSYRSQGRVAAVPVGGMRILSAPEALRVARGEEGANP